MFLIEAMIPLPRKLGRQAAIMWKQLHHCLVKFRCHVLLLVGVLVCAVLVFAGIYSG